MFSSFEARKLISDEGWLDRALRRRHAERSVLGWSWSFYRFLTSVIDGFSIIFQGSFDIYFIKLWIGSSFIDN